MKTEEQARKCWCPFAKAVALNDSGQGYLLMPMGRVFNDMKDGRLTYEDHCIASECMMWEFHWGNKKGEWIEPQDRKFGDCCLKRSA